MNAHVRRFAHRVFFVVLGAGLVLSAAAAHAGTTPYVSYDGNLIITAGGDLYNPSVPGAGGSMTGAIGSNSADSNTWGSGSTSTATGPDIGSTWRTAALTKVFGILDASATDGLIAPADLNQPMTLTVTLGGQTVGSANSAGYEPRAYLYGIDTAPSGNAGWWGSADTTTKSVSAATPLTTGTWNAGAGTWTFQFTTPGLVTADSGDLLGIAIVGNEDAVANESLSWAGNASSLTVTPDIARVPYDNNGNKGGNLVTTAGGDLWNPSVGPTNSGNIGSNANDSNTWGTNSTAGATGPDIVTNGTTWRLAALTKVGAILDATAGDILATPADLNRPLKLTMVLGGQTAGPNTSADYVPLAYLVGIDETPSGDAGWWDSADKTTQAVSGSTPLTAGEWDAAAGTWTFEFFAADGLVTADRGDLLGIAIVGNEDAVADEWLQFSEGSVSSLTVEAIPEPATLILFSLGIVPVWRRLRRRA